MNMDFSTEANINVVKRSIESLIESERFNDADMFESDMNLCYDSITNYNETENHERGLYDNVLEHIITTVSCEELQASKGYCEFVVFLALAECNNMYAVKMLALCFNKLIDLAVKYPVLRYTSVTLFENIVEQLLYENELIESAIKKCVLDLKFLESQVTLTRSHDFKELDDKHFATMKINNGILTTLSENEYRLDVTRFTRQYIEHFIKIYSKFQSRTFVEWENTLAFENIIADKKKYHELMSTIKHLLYICPQYEQLILRKLVKYWPSAYHYQEIVIGYFMEMCKDLSRKEISEELQGVIVKQFDKLFLYSQSRIFICAYWKAENVFEDELITDVEDDLLRIDFVGFKNCFGEQHKLFLDNKTKYLISLEKLHGKKKRKKQLICKKNKVLKARRHKRSFHMVLRSQVRNRAPAKNPPRRSLRLKIKSQNSSSEPPTKKNKNFNTVLQKLNVRNFEIQQVVIRKLFEK